MILQGEFGFDGPREVVWELLQDPEVLAKALPGTKTLERSGTDSYQGVMQIGVGPVTAAEFSVNVRLKDQAPPERFAMEVDSKGDAGFTRGTALVELAERAGGGTVMRYTADLKIGGKIAGVGQRVLDSVAKSMTRQGLETLNRELQSRLRSSQPGQSTVRRPPRVLVAGVILGFLVSLLWLCGPV